MRLGNGRRVVFLLIPSICLLLLMAGLVYARSTIDGATFYVTADGVEKSDFSPGEALTLMAVATTPTPVTVNLHVTMDYPPGSGRGSINIFSDRVTIAGTVTIKYRFFTISSGDPLGYYDLHISVYDTAGNLQGEGPLYFSVSVTPASPSPAAFPWEMMLAVVVIVVVAVVGGFLFYRRVRGPGPAMPEAGPGGETVAMKEPGTLVMTRSTGETVTYIAGLMAGQRMIPLSSLPQSFGRHDLQGVVPEESLKFISRKHFELSYNYSRGSFMIEDRGSANGTFLNDEEIKGKGPKELKDGDVIGLGGVVNLKFTIKAT